MEEDKLLESSLVEDIILWVHIKKARDPWYFEDEEVIQRLIVLRLNTKRSYSQPDPYIIVRTNNPSKPLLAFYFYKIDAIASRFVMNVGLCHYAKNYPVI